MEIKKNGIHRICTEKQFIDTYKSQGYIKVEPDKESNKKTDKKAKKWDISEYFIGGGWYKYEGKSYRKADLLEVLK